VKIYLCARYGKRDYLLACRAQLELAGHDVTSRWLDTSWEGKGEGSSAAPPEYRQQYAVKDLQDVEECDLLIAFTEPPDQGGRGGRHVELGAAIAWGKRVFVVGHYENIFCHHPRVEFFKDWAEALFMLTEAE
jgi:hypothetical protein